jgi:hypothetical protein
MANVQKYFEQFHRRIRTDYEMSEMLREKRDIILNRIRRHLAERGRPGFVEMNQGSYKMKTGVVPIADLEYDIDVGLRFDFSETDYDAKTVRGWVFEAVDGHTEKVESRGPCIRVTYKDGYHVDLVVYARWTDAFGAEHYRLAHRTGGWRPADPVRLLAIIREARRPYEGTEDGATKTDQFRRCVRYQRRWIDEEIPRESTAKPTGLAFVLLAMERLSPHTTWMGLLDDRAALEALARSAANTYGRITAVKPTPEHEEMFGRLTDEEMGELKGRYVVMAEALRKADEEPDPVVACRILQKVFGPDFPVPEPEDTARKTSTPAIVTSSSSA